jgi:3-deoxy-D-manno-octulosonic-acid transferase
VRPIGLSLYAAAASAAAPGLRVLLRRRERRGKEIGDRLAERLGRERAPRPHGPLVWIHAASVGETVSVLPVLASLAAKAPTLAALLTTGTVTSARLLGTRLPELGLAGRVLHRFAPLDVPAWASRFLDHWRPDAACFVESELWPNLLGAAHRRSIQLMLMNARLSPRSFARWRRVPSVTFALLDSFTRIEARSEQDAARLALLGARRVGVSGDLKFATPPLPADTSELARLRAILDGRPVWLAASTHPGEDAVVREAHLALASRHPDLLTVLVPRHPERGAAIAKLAAGLATRRGAAADPPKKGGIYVADTLGELGLWYRLASVAFIGGSLVPHGGQNPLEGGRLGCALATGPHTGNFADAVAALEQAGAISRVADAAGLADWVGAMLTNPDRRRAAGEAARGAADRWADLPDRYAEMVLDLVGSRLRR